MNNINKTSLNKNTKVNFYILSDSDLDNRLYFVCKLVEKAFKKNATTLVISDDSNQLNTIDRLIWSFNTTSFIPHEIITPNLRKPFPTILLTENINNINTIDFKPDIAIDLTYDARPLSFPRVMLLANQHKDILSNARLKYQSYIKYGIKPDVHHLDFK